jgi:hypothetical protein
MPRLYAPLARLLVILLVSSWLSAATVALPPAPESLLGTTVVLNDGGGEAETFVAPVATRVAAAPQSRFEVKYDNFPPEAEAAVQYAVEIWQSLLVSPVPIRVAASWEPMEEGQLGAARATRYLRNFPGAPRRDTFYPVALADALASDDQRPGESDIIITINSDYTNWYYGTETTPRRQSSLVAVVLHEIGHGIGFSGTALVANGKGSWSTSIPRIYDLFVTTGTGESLRDEDRFPTYSADLRDALQSGDLRFAGPHATVANGGEPPLLFAPTVWEQGSSFGHLDEETYPAGDPNALMTPYLDRGESNYDPGPVALGVLADLGWPLADGAAPALPDRALDLTPGLLDLGDVPLGATGQPQTVTLTNVGASTITLARGSGFGPNGSGFATLDETCTAAPVAPGARCTPHIAFPPHEPRRATLTWQATAPGGESLATLTLRASGIANTTGDGLIDDPRCVARAGRCLRVSPGTLPGN